MITRKSFLVKSVAGVAGLIPGVSLAGNFFQDKPAPIEAQLVRAFVGKGHSDLEGVKQMLEETPGILNALDWGGGDYETALGGASHMGRPDIAQFLIDKGARMDIFAAAMMGKADVVKAIVTAYPASLHSKGAHGISLMTHALKGGDAAREVVDFLKSQGVGS